MPFHNATTHKFILTFEDMIDIPKKRLLFHCLMPKWKYHEKNLYVTGTLFWEFSICNQINDATTKKIIQTFEDLIETQKMQFSSMV
jgi:hypothetical protein